MGGWDRKCVYVSFDGSSKNSICTLENDFEICSNHVDNLGIPKQNVKLNFLSEMLVVRLRSRVFWTLTRWCFDITTTSHFHIRYIGFTT